MTDWTFGGWFRPIASSQENFAYEHWDDILEICKQYDVPLAQMSFCSWPLRRIDLYNNNHNITIISNIVIDSVCSFRILLILFVQFNSSTLHLWLFEVIEHRRRTPSWLHQGVKSSESLGIWWRWDANVLGSCSEIFRMPTMKRNSASSRCRAIWPNVPGRRAFRQGYWKEDGRDTEGTAWSNIEHSGGKSEVFV